MDAQPTASNKRSRSMWVLTVCAAFLVVTIAATSLIQRF